ncbi:hypothetical protein LINPERPRIM_LOCUS16270 [Linum perenne]
MHTQTRPEVPSHQASPDDPVRPNPNLPNHLLRPPHLHQSHLP